MNKKTAEPPTSGVPTNVPTGRSRAVLDVLVLCMVTGIVEAVCLIHLGHVFAAYVTGTVILAGAFLATEPGLSIVPYVVAIGGFLVGSMVGGRLVRGRAPRRTRYVRALLGEALLLLVAAGVFATFPPSWSQVTSPLALALCACAMAIQFSATRYLDVPQLRIAAATGLVHGLIYESVSGRLPALLPRRVLALVALLAGAAIGGIVSQWSVAAGMALAGLIALLAAGWAVLGFRGRPDD